MNVYITLTSLQARQLEELLWEVCTETDEGVRTLRKDLPETAVWRKVATALGCCPDCGGRGAQLENGVYYCNCEEAA